jgi:hypothetical protein
MAQNSRSAADIRQQIQTEREQLSRAVDELRAGIGEATDVRSKLGANLPTAAGVALAAGFVLAGGIGATVRLVFRRGRESSALFRVGRFVVVDRDD